VREAAVVAAGGADGRVSRLVAYVAVGQGWSEQAARSAVAARLPTYMCPAAWVLLTDWPRTSTEKIDRRALAAQAAHISVERAGEAPRTAAEQQVADVFAEVLGIARLPRDAEFFDLGGHSLLAPRIAMLLSTRCESMISVRDIFEHPVIKDLAQLIETRSPRPATDHSPRPLAFPPQQSFEQQLLTRLEAATGVPVPAIPLLVRIPAPVDRLALQEALAALLRRHTALQPLGSTATQPDLPLPAIHAADESEALHSLLQTAFADGAPGLRLVMLGETSRHQRALLLLARSRSDGQSLAVLLEELQQLLGDYSDLPPAPRYEEYIAWQQDRYAANSLRAETYWRERVGGSIGQYDLFAQQRHHMRRSFLNQTSHAWLPAEIVQRLSTLIEQERVTIRAAFIAALGLLAARWSGQDIVLIGTPMSRRWDARFDRLVGRCVELLPVLCTAGAAPTFRHLLAAIQAELADAQAQSDLPFVKLIDLLDPVDLTTRPPVVQCAVNLHDSMPAGVLGWGIEELEHETHWSDLDLVLHIRTAPSGPWHLMLSTALDIFDAVEARSWLDQLVMIVRRAVATPDTLLADLLPRALAETSPST
jgi:hypothetical protein